MKFRNLFAYLNQRFPVVNMALFAILFLTVFSVAIFFSGSDKRFANMEFAGILVTIFFFFRLRFFDEVKDYEIDCINHPQRVLQSGKITLKELGIITIAGTLLEFGWSAMMGSTTLMIWFAALAYSLLMRYEFFVSEWLKKRLLLYAFSHMLIMPWVILWIWSAYNAEYHSGLILLALLSLLGGFSFELARKIHVPEAERSTVDSYSKSLGYVPAIIAVNLVLVSGIAVLFFLLMSISASALPYWLIAALFIITIIVYLNMIIRPRENGLRKAELLVSLFMLVSYLAVIVEINIDL